MVRKKTKRKKKVRGFTLIELLISFGILAVLLSITLIAVNPGEQISKTNDLSIKATASEIAKATLQEYIETKKMPWEANSNCMNELLNGGTLADMPNCVHALNNNVALENNPHAMSQLREIYAVKCGDSAVLCFSPKSKSYNQDANAKYNKYGAQQPGCPPASGTSPECYVCIPVKYDPACQNIPTPTPTIVPINTPTPPPTLVPTNTPIPTSTPTPPPVMDYGSNYSQVTNKNTFRTYAVADDYENRVVTISLMLDNANARVTSLLADNGTPVTKLASADCPSGTCRAELWYMLNPPVGVNWLNVTLSDYANLLVVKTILRNVNQSNPVASTVGTSGYSDTALYYLSNTNYNQLIYTALAGGGVHKFDGFRNWLGGSEPYYYYNGTKFATTYRSVRPVYSPVILNSTNGPENWAVAAAAFNPAIYIPPPSVASDVTKPDAFIATPKANTVVTKNTDVPISVYATDNVGVTKVEVLVNNTLLCTKTAPPYECTWHVPGESNTSYSLTHKTYDQKGNVREYSITVTSSQ